MKTRLNRDMRTVLTRLAIKVVQDTPIDPDIERRVTKAITGYDNAFKLLASEATKLVNKAYTPGEILILRKFGFSEKVNDPMFVDLDDRDRFQVELFNNKQYDRKLDQAKRLGAEKDSDRTSWEERQKASATHDKAKKAVMVEVVVNKGARVYGHRAITGTKALSKLRGKLIDAGHELDMGEGADDERRRTILQDFRALIESSRNFEDVVIVWPEAKTVTDQIVASGQAISLMSVEAVKRIQANMKSRGV